VPTDKAQESLLDNPAPAATAPTKATSGDIDEDLFDFGQLFSPNDLAEAGEHISKADLFDETVPANVEPVVEEEVAEAPAAAVSTGAATPAEAAAVATPSVQPVMVAAPASPIKTRVLIGLLASVLLLSALLIMIAWQTSRAFQNTLEGVRADLTANGGGRQQPIVIQVPGPNPAAITETNTQAPVPLDDYEAQELSIARSELAAAQYSTARVRLFSLLANRDRLNMSGDAVADAEYLIAESYLMQAKNLPGDEK